MATSNDEDSRQVVQYGDQQVERGHGGETHRVAAGGGPRLTTQQGTVVSDDQNTLRAGERGPAALEDFHFREKIFHFDHERIPERVVHARGYGAHGYFECAGALAAQPAARDFVTDAYAHAKFIGHMGAAAPLFEAAGLSRLMDDGFVSLDQTAAAEFISRCAQLRFWPRPAPPGRRSGSLMAGEQGGTRRRQAVGMEGP